MTTDETIDTLFNLAEGIAATAGASPLVAIGLHAAQGLVGELRRESDGSIRLVQARETEAGRAISKASHLAGLREFLVRTLYVNFIPTMAVAEQAADAIMAEVARRMP